MIEKKYENIPFYIFATNENTIDLCIYSIKKLGFKNIKLIDGKDGFSQKYLRFVKDAYNQKSDLYIRTDADRICFEGLLKCIDVAISNKDTWVEGAFFDYFMNKSRGGTPHIIPKKAIDYLKINPDIIKDSLKPETDLNAHLRNKNIIKFKHVKVITNLHDWYQFPSKVCNTFLTRIKRNHYHLYDINHIVSLDQCYVKAWNEAMKNVSNKKDNMNYNDFTFLDKEFEDIIDASNIKEKYRKLLEIYDSKK